jgi:hypothetical protein
VLATFIFHDRRICRAWHVAALVSTPELRRILLSISPDFARIPADGLDALDGALPVRGYANRFGSQAGSRASALAED